MPRARVLCVLEGTRLRPNHYIELDPDDAAGHCRFDFKTVYADGTSVIRRNVDACTFTRFPSFRSTSTSTVSADSGRALGLSAAESPSL